jgi:CheY-like chemotaxis protein/two-component sensor histidine kinase
MMVLELEPVDLNSLLSNSLSIVREKAAAQRIQIELEAGEDMGQPLLDMRKTKQIVYNLLSNAVKFSANGGRVILRARRVPRSAVGTLPGTWPVHSFPLADNDFNEFLEICVSDSGIGLSRENMAKLFQAFSQIDSGLARKFEGTGLGLAMVKQMAELHGGAVAVASAMGEGARFAVWLPLRAPAQAAAEPSQSVPMSNETATPLPRNVPDVAGAATRAAVEPRERIALVIDDDDKAAELLRLFLEAEGFTVLRAVSAEDALLLVPRQALALITLDLQLYSMNGWQFLQQIRENTRGHAPVVIISGRPVDDMAQARGAAAVLLKPVSRDQLKATLVTLGLLPTRDKPTR